MVIISQSVSLISKELCAGRCYSCNCQCDHIKALQTWLSKTNPCPLREMLLLSVKMSAVHHQTEHESVCVCVCE